MDSSITNKVNLLYSRFCNIVDKIIDEKNKKITINILSAKRVDTDLLNVNIINAQDINSINLNCETISGESVIGDMVAVDKILTNRLRTKNFSSKNSNISNLNAKNIVCTEIAVISDQRLKKDIKKKPINLEDTDHLNCYQYKYINNIISLDPDDDKLHIGLMAQEVEKIYPEAVSYNGGKKTVNYIQLIPILIEYIKELRKEVGLLKNK